MQPNSQYLLKLAYTKMPFGKYKDWYLSDIPDAYYVWFQQKGFPNNNLGKQMQEIYELKLNGLEFLLKELRNKPPKP